MAPLLPITHLQEAHTSTFDQLFGWTFNQAATKSLNLPPEADGAALRQGDQIRYVLWAKTTQDHSEEAYAVINLPGTYDLVTWDGTSSIMDGTNLELRGAPIFLTPH